MDDFRHRMLIGRAMPYFYDKIGTNIELRNFLLNFNTRSSVEFVYFYKYRVWVPKKLKYVDNPGFQRAKVLWSCPRKEGSQGRKTAGGGRQICCVFHVPFYRPPSSLKKKGLRLALEE